VSTGSFFRDSEGKIMGVFEQLRGSEMHWTIPQSSQLLSDTFSEKKLPWEKSTILFHFERGYTHPK